MATIKAYTDISQSKKLAEILPLESADMYWDYDVQKHEDYPMIMDEQFDDTCVKAWSLASLLGVLPDNYIDDDTVYHPNLMKTKDGRYMVIYNVSQYTSLCNNPIDACYEMIIKLNELKML